jgi:hypothetical protein
MPSNLAFMESTPTNMAANDGTGVNLGSIKSPKSGNSKGKVGLSAVINKNHHNKTARNDGNNVA